jgi:hypothetical protein
MSRSRSRADRTERSARRSRVAARWLLRLLDEHKAATIEESALVASALAALGGLSHEDVYATFTALAARAAGLPPRS